MDPRVEGRRAVAVFSVSGDVPLVDVRDLAVPERSCGVLGGVAAVWTKRGVFGMPLSIRCSAATSVDEASDLV